LFFIPDPVFLPIPDPGFRGQKGTGARSATLLETFYIKALAAQAAINQQLQAAGATSQAMATQAALAYVQQIQV
jgi:hypothetical protein